MGNQTFNTSSRQVPSMPARTTSMLERIRMQCLSGRTEWQDSTAAESRIDVTRYTSPAIYQREIEQLFRSLPLMVAHSSELKVGQIMAHDAYDLPILLSRDQSGTVHAHLNVCRHRGTRLVNSAQAINKTSIVCPYHGWTYQLDGAQSHRLHAEAFDVKPCEQEDLVPLPCAERHGLIWVIPNPEASKDAIDLDTYLGGLNAEMPFYEIENLTHFRTIEAEYPANWKLIVDAFLESYHIRVLHKNTIYPFFTDGITASERFGSQAASGPHIHSLVARREAQEWTEKANGLTPQSVRDLSELVTPSQLLFPNTITIFHPEYLSLITLYPTGPETLRWTHKMLIPKDRSGDDWTAHWEKTFQLIEQGVFQKEDIHTAVSIQKGFKSGANKHLRLGRNEEAVGWFHISANV
jgi:phenylpropionate dioxygenase-like ring-hydroxylating dioxygenase large terminal subunit